MRAASGRGWVLAFVLGAALCACGGAEPVKAPPKAPAGAPAGVAVKNDQGQQVGMTDAPSSRPASGEPSPDANRPKMNYAASQAYAKAMNAFANGDLAAAKAGFEEAMAADSNAYQAAYSLGVVQERLDNVAGALASYRKAFTIVSDYETAIVAHAMLQARRATLGEAESFLNGMRSKLPKSPAVLTALSEVKSMGRDTATAQNLAQEALKLNPDYRPAMLTIARDHYRNRRLDLSQYALKAILDGFGEENPPRDKDNADAHYLRALILREEMQRQPAMAALRKVVDLRPDAVAARVDLAAMWLESGNADEARPLLERALKYDAGHVIAHLLLGDCYRLMAKPQEAKVQFDWVMQHDSSLPQVHYDLALLYLFSPNIPGMTPQKQVEAAISEIEKYQQMRAKAATQNDDSDELLKRAKDKLEDLKAESTAKAAASAAPPASSAPGGAGSAPKPAGSAPAPGGTAAPGGSAAPGGAPGGALPDAGKAAKPPED